MCNFPFVQTCNNKTKEISSFLIYLSNAVYIKNFCSFTPEYLSPLYIERVVDFHFHFAAEQMTRVHMYHQDQCTCMSNMEVQTKSSCVSCIECAV